MSVVMRRIYEPKRRRRFWLYVLLTVFTSIRHPNERCIHHLHPSSPLLSPLLAACRTRARRLPLVVSFRGASSAHVPVSRPSRASIAAAPARSSVPFGPERETLPYARQSRRFVARSRAVETRDARARRRRARRRRARRARDARCSRCRPRCSRRRWRSRRRRARAPRGSKIEGARRAAIRTRR